MEIDTFGPEDIMWIQWDEIRSKIAEYIRNQLASDQIADQIGLKEFVDLFTGRENKNA